MNLKNSSVFFLGLALPALLVFKTMLLPGPAVWGDAPYFYPERLKELVAEPYIWTGWGENFGGINNLLWIYPLMLLYGLLHTLLGLTNDTIIRILFYFPAIVSAFVTPIFFAKYLGYQKIVQFFTSLLYGLNTYFLLLIDGGQVGIALAYGIFPLTLLTLRKLIDLISIKNFYLAVISLLILTITDVRFGAIALFTVGAWWIVELVSSRKFYLIKNLLALAFLGASILFVGSYWFIPLGLIDSGIRVNFYGSQFITLFHSLFLFQPHWPLNEFGKVSPPPFYFIGIPILILGGLLFSARSRAFFGQRPTSLLLGFLLFAFLAKGSSPPFGGWYEWMVANVPFGVALRDTSKFFAPLLLFGGVLSGIFIESFVGFLKIKVTPLHKSVTFAVSFFIIAASYVYLLFLIYPAIGGQLRGVLSSSEFSQDFSIIHKKLSQQEGFFRTAWFPERHPLGFHTEEKPTLNAKLLVEERPFASLNVGTFDAFNFMHQKEFLDWFDLLGIKYLIFSGDPRKINLNEEEKKNWDELLGLTATTSGLILEDWGTSFPVYSVPTPKPQIFAVDKLVIVVGSDDIYEKIKKLDKQFSVGNQPFVFLEDGKFDPRNLQDIASDSAVLVFNEKAEIDLTMSFLQKYFVAPQQAKMSRWAMRDQQDYLKWKYELLTRNIDIKEFDYARGIAFSTVLGEKITFDITVPNDAEYILAARTMQRDTDESLELQFFGTMSVTNNEAGKFEWYIREGLPLKKGVHEVSFKNNGAMNVFNAVALIPKEEWEEQQQLTRNFLGHFKVIKIDGVNDEQELRGMVGTKWIPVEHNQISPVRYKVTIPKQGRWIVFTDSYNPKWQLKKGVEFLPSYPFYSMINGFYFDHRWKDTEVVFRGQEDVRWGMYFSAISILFLAVVFLWQYSKKYD